MMTFSGKETDGSDYSKRVDDGYAKAKRQAKMSRLLQEMEIHTTMEINDEIYVLRVIGGWVYFHWTDKTAAGAFVPERRFG